MAVSEEHGPSTRIAGREQAAEKIVELRNQEIPERLAPALGTKNSSRRSWRYRGPHRRPPHGEDDAEFLLGVPASSDSTGRNVAAVVLKEVDEMGVRDKINRRLFRHHGFDTGRCQGACIRIEQELGRSLLWWPAATCPRGDPQEFLKPASALPLVLTLEFSTTP
ncbi:hypothetical protein GWK47_040037 [Chionoecetes opilio]|uniref:Uncharacterized protein n=1 Tax=Chionoecetes opilio TaxID=41210 RepID=A0A8J5D034_CHIOP|nr:hypothetical protein GWK47_040037 [Chionoecetes opilio]